MYLLPESDAEHPLLAADHADKADWLVQEDGKDNCGFAQGEKNANEQIAPGYALRQTNDQQQESNGCCDGKAELGAPLHAAQNALFHEVGHPHPSHQTAPVPHSRRTGAIIISK